jgi:pimeloyl-ACP methyl ester carboxylesterase
MTTDVQVQDKFVELGGLRFHFRAWGSRSTPTLVILHGATSHARSNDGLARAMADRCRVLAYDQRGHGETDWAKNYAIDSMLGDLAAFIRQLGLGRVALVGYSMGGVVAYLYAAQHPEQVDRLVIGDIGPNLATSAAAAQAQAGFGMAAQAVFDEPETAVQIARALDPLAAEADLREHTLYNLVQRDDGHWAWRFDGAGLARDLFSHGPSEAEQWNSLSQLRCPTLLLRGAQSEMLSLDEAERMAKTIQNCRFVEIPSSGHPIPLDNPAGLLAAVEPFLVSGTS